MPREQFISEMESKLNEFDKKLVQLEARPRPKAEKARQEYEQAYHNIRKHQDTLRDQLRQAANTTDDGWQSFKNSVERVYDDMVRYMDEAGHRAEGRENVGMF